MTKRSETIFQTKLEKSENLISFNPQSTEMEYQFHQHTTPRQVKEFSLFNSTPFVTRHGNQPIQFLLLEKGTRVGIINFNISNHSAFSPLKATFGGFEFNKEIPSLILRDFVTWVIGEIVKKNVNEIRISLAPEFHQPMANEVISDILEDCHFEHIKETGQVIECNRSNFRQVINRFEVTKMDRCLNDSFLARRAESIIPQSVFEMIIENRKRKSIPVNISYSELVKNFKNFPTYFNWFGVWKDDKVVAGSIGIQVRSDTLNYFFPGHDNKFDKWSPIVLLLNEMYMFCIRRNIKYLDLGKSSFNGAINAGLFQFKNNLGASTYSQSQFKWTVR